MMREHYADGRSTAFLTKLADHYRTAGQAFLAEDFLRQQVRRGRRDVSIRLAEHWVEFGCWRSARELLKGLLKPRFVTPDNRHLRPAAGRKNGGGATETGRSSGDEDPPAPETIVREDHRMTVSTQSSGPTFIEADAQE